VPDHDPHLQHAIELATASARDGGGPFGAVITRGDVVLATGTNGVTRDHDPTAHAEIVAIRAACRAQRDFRLTGAVLHTSCEPCPMCLAAAFWARIDRIVFAATRDDAAHAGFDDAAIYAEVVAPMADRTLPIAHLELPDALAPFDVWAHNGARTDY
jgi:guanine deaminase